MLDLRCLYNLAWPGEAQSTKDAKLIYKFIHTIKDHKMSEYLWDKDCKTPDEVVRAAERKRCGQSGLDRAHAMIDPSKMADSAGIYTTYQGQRGPRPKQTGPQQQRQTPSNPNAGNQPARYPNQAVTQAADGEPFVAHGPTPAGVPTSSNARRNKRRRNRGRTQSQNPNPNASNPATQGQSTPAFPIFGTAPAAPQQQQQPAPAFPVFGSAPAANRQQQWAVPVVGPMPDLNTPPPPLPQTAQSASGVARPASGN